MPLRAPYRPMLRRAAGMAALGALLAPTLTTPAPVQAAPRPKAPVITSVAPLDLAVGQTLTLRGRNFIKGRNRNTVVFKRDGGRAVFVKAELATAKLLKVTVPKKLESALLLRGDERRSTRFELRVLGRKLSRATRPGLSPVIAPAPAAADAPAGDPTAPPVLALPPASAPEPDGAALAPEPCKLDDDLLDEATENRLGLDPCGADSDGDGVEDGYEYRSALDLNDDDYETPNQSRPAPERRPYPNPRFADAERDYDGDSLTLMEEFRLWKHSIAASGAPRSLDALSYSDGEQYSVHSRANGRREPSLAAAGYVKHTQFLDWAAARGELTVSLLDPTQDAFAATATRTDYDIRDFDRDGNWVEDLHYYDLGGADGYLSDEERDEDADGLTNFAEGHNCMQRSFWFGLYEGEIPYPIAFDETDMLDADTDGDGVRDGVDDQDHDDVPNLMECSRRAAAGEAIRPAPDTDPSDDGQPLKAFVNPFNPCLPAKRSRACPRFVPVSGTVWAPFTKDAKYFFIKN